MAVPLYQIIQADATNLPLADASVDVVFGSPPYPEKGERYSGRTRRWPSEQWATWMCDVTREALRVSRGPVAWVVNNAVKQSRYLPAVERLMVSLHDAGVHLERPCIWHKNAPPNRRDWFGNDWEYVVVAKHPGPVPYFDWRAVASPPKYKVGGRFRQRGSDGRRRLGSEYPKNKLARPRDVVRVTVGGGHLGSSLAHQNEAPFPQDLASHFVKVLCPPAGVVLDPFTGSGSTAAAAIAAGRQVIASDIREDQCDLTRKRILELVDCTGTRGPGPLC